MKNQILILLITSLTTLNFYAQQKTLLDWQGNINPFQTTDQYYKNYNSQLPKKSTNLKIFQEDEVSAYSKEVDWTAKMLFALELIKLDYTVYEDILGVQNTDYLSGNLPTGIFETIIIKNNFHYGVGWGLGFGESNNNDSLRISNNQFIFQLLFGRSLVESGKFSIVPKCNLKWRRQRLLNNDIDWKISLADYVDEKALDIRFSHVFVTAYLDISYKHIPEFGVEEFWSFGGYVGYIEALNSRPWIYSTFNRLTNDRKLDVDNFTFGLYAAINI